VHVREFVNMLAALGHSVALVCADRGSGNPDPKAELIVIAPTRDLKTREAAANRWSVALDLGDKALCRELDKLAYDFDLPARALALLQARGFVPDVVYERFALFQQGGAIMATRLGVPYLVEVNAPLVEEEDRHRVLRLADVAKAVERRVYRRAAHVL